MLALPNGVVRVWDLKTKGPFFSDTKTRSGPPALSIRGDNVLAAHTDGSLLRYHFKDSRDTSFYLSAQSEPIVGAQLYDKGAAACVGRRLVVWDGRGMRSAELKLSGVPSTIAASPTGLAVAIGTQEGNVFLWSSQGRSLRNFTGHKGPITSITYRPDAGLLATASKDRTVRLWDLQRGTLENTIARFTGPVRQVLFCAEGRLLVCLSEGQPPQVFSPRGGVQQYELRGHQGEVLGVYEKEGALLTTSKDQTARLWDTDKGALLATYPAIASAQAACFLGAWDAIAVLEDTTPTLRLYRGSVAQTQFTIPGESVAPAASPAPKASPAPQARASTPAKPNHTPVLVGGRCRALVLRQDGALAGFLSHYGTLRTIDLHTRRALPLRGEIHYGGATRLALSPDEKNYVVSTRSKGTLIADLQQGILRASLGPGWGASLSAAFHPTNPVLAVSHWSGLVSYWDTNSWRNLWKVQAHPAPANDLLFSQDGAFLVSAGSDQTVKVWTAQEGKLLHTLSGHEEKVLRLYHAPNGAVLSHGFDSFAVLWDLRQGAPRAFLRGHSDSIVHAAISPDGSRIATASIDGSARLWTLSGESPRVLEHTAPVRHVAFSPQGKTLLTCSDDHSLALWNSDDGSKIKRLTQQGEVSHGRFLAENRVLIASNGYLLSLDV
jgi:WD40 repeat protein